MKKFIVPLEVTNALSVLSGLQACIRDFVNKHERTKVYSFGLSKPYFTFNTYHGNYTLSSVNGLTISKENFSGNTIEKVVQKFMDRIKMNPPLVVYFCIKKVYLCILLKYQEDGSIEFEYEDVTEV